jgi:hypothetical protein
MAGKARRDPDAWQSRCAVRDGEVVRHESHRSCPAPCHARASQVRTEPGEDRLGRIVVGIISGTPTSPFGASPRQPPITIVPSGVCYQFSPVGVTEAPMPVVKTGCSGS